MSRVLDWSSPETASVVRPGATAVTTPVRLTRATPASAADHCRASGLTTRPPCVGTTTRSVSTSPGESRSGLGSWIAMSLGVTTIGAVAVRPVVLVTCTVPCPCASATMTPFWSTLAISGRSDFHVTATGAAGDPSSLSARGDTRVFSEGSRYTVGGSMRSTVAGGLPHERIWARTGGGSRRGRLRRRLRRSGGSAHDLHRRLSLPGAYPCLDDRHPTRHAGDRAVVVHLRDRDVVGRPNDAHRRDDVAGAVERRRQQPGALPHLDRHRRWSDLDFGHILAERGAREGEYRQHDDETRHHSGANVNGRKCRCQANL